MSVGAMIVAVLAYKKERKRTMSHSTPEHSGYRDTVTGEPKRCDNLHPDDWPEMPDAIIPKSVASIEASKRTCNEYVHENQQLREQLAAEREKEKWHGAFKQAFETGQQIERERDETKLQLAAEREKVERMSKAYMVCNQDWQTATEQLAAALEINKALQEGQLRGQFSAEQERILLEVSRDRTATGHATKVEQIALELKQQLAAEREHIGELASVANDLGEQLAAERSYSKQLQDSTLTGKQLTAEREKLAARDLLIKQLNQDVEAKERRLDETNEQLAAERDFKLCLAGDLNTAVEALKATRMEALGVQAAKIIDAALAKIGGRDKHGT